MAVVAPTAVASRIKATSSKPLWSTGVACQTVSLAAALVPPKPTAAGECCARGCTGRNDTAAFVSLGPARRGLRNDTIHTH